MGGPKVTLAVRPSKDFRQCSGRCLPPYTWSIESGSLPPGLSLIQRSDGDAELIGTPTTTGAFPFTLALASSDGRAVTEDVTITVTAAASGDGLITVTFSGFLHTFTDNANLLDPSYAAGDPFTGSFSYPSDLIDSDPDPEFFSDDDSRIVSFITFVGHVFSGAFGGHIRIDSRAG